MNISRLIAALCLSAAVFSTTSAATQPIVKVIVIRVDDMQAALNFYCGFLLFEKSGRVDNSNEVSLSHASAEILLNRVPKRSSTDFESTAHVNLNMMVADIQRTVSLARKAGFDVLDTIPQQAQIGAFYRVLDPAGNMLHLIQPNFDFGDLSKPTVFNLGIQVSDMKKAREFYFSTLGFSVLTEKYYPPVVPINSVGFEMILHEGSNKPAAKRSLDETGISVVIELNNFGSLARKLKLDPTKSPVGQPELVIYDPDGNLITVANSN